MTALAFYLIRRANELNFPTYGKAILTFFCTFPLYFGLEVASYFSMNQKNTSFQLSELKEAGVEISTIAESYIAMVGYKVADGQASLTPELPYVVMYATI